MKRPSSRIPRGPRASGRNGRPAAPDAPARPVAPRQDAFHQGKAHVSDAAGVERNADDAAAGRAGQPAPEGNTPGGVSS